MDNLVSILKIPILNIEVKNNILRLVQNWSIAFEGKPALSYVGQVYKTLTTEGVHVPNFQKRFQISFVQCRVQIPSEGSCSSKFGDGGHTNCPRMDRLGRVSPLPHPLQLYKPQASLSELWPSFRPTMLVQVDTSSSLWYHPGSPRM